MKHKPDDKDVIKVKRRKKGKKINSNKNINDAIRYIILALQCSIFICRAIVSARERAIRTFLSECRRNFKLETAYTDMSQTHAR